MFVQEARADLFGLFFCAGCGECDSGDSARRRERFKRFSVFGFPGPRPTMAGKFEGVGERRVGEAGRGQPKLTSLCSGSPADFCGSRLMFSSAFLPLGICAGRRVSRSTNSVGLPNNSL